MATTKIMFEPLGTAEFVLLGMCTGAVGCPAQYHVNGCIGRPGGRLDGCACRFPAVTEAGDSAWSSAWERQHVAFHLAVFPGVRDDDRSMRNLREAVIYAIKRERGCDYRTRYSNRTGDSVTKTIYCGEHDDWSFSFPISTVRHTWDDPGREPWHDHIMDGSAPL